LGKEGKGKLINDRGRKEIISKKERKRVREFIGLTWKKENIQKRIYFCFFPP